jgi:formylglycine-generating enzyme required for sulfatase activity
MYDGPQRRAVASIGGFTMTTLAAKTVTVADLLLPAALLLGLTVFSLSQIGVVSLGGGGASAGPETIVVAARAYEHRMPGDFQMGGVPVNGLLLHEEFRSVEVMREQVSLRDFGRCVADGACHVPAPAVRSHGDDVPVTGVSYDDAVDYARWLSGRTGDNWRLPTVAEWIFVAGERAVDHAIEKETDSANPAERWLAAYEQETSRAVRPDALPKPRGYFGANAFGIGDIAGNVWEWTATCANRTTLTPAGAIDTVTESCGVHYLEGRHLTPMSAFVRDAKGGGCSVGAPPDNLGFRLVRDSGFRLRLPF